MLLVFPVLPLSDAVATAAGSGSLASRLAQLLKGCARMVSTDKNCAGMDAVEDTSIRVEKLDCKQALDVHAPTVVVVSIDS